MKRVAVLVTVHNRRETTLRCLQLLYQQQYDTSQFSVEVFMTNDGCTDGTEVAVQENFPDVHIIQGDGNLYWNRGMIVAWSEATKDDFDYYLWLNDDTLLYKNALETLLYCSNDKNNAAIIVGSMCAVGNTSIITYGGCSSKSVPIQDVSHEQTCELMNGNLVLIPRKVYEQLGKHNPIYHHALGDFDYARRAVQKSIKIYVAQGVLGECDRRIPLWNNPQQSLIVRFKDYWKVTGANPKDVFLYNRLFFGLAKACIYFCTGFVHMLFPNLYNKVIA